MLFSLMQVIIQFRSACKKKSYYRHTTDSDLSAADAFYTGTKGSVKYSCPPCGGIHCTGQIHCIDCTAPTEAAQIYLYRLASEREGNNSSRGSQ